MTAALFSGGIPRILVADDDEVIRMLLIQFLEGEGYQVQGAVNGREAMDIASAATFDLIILDIAMPDYDGYTICENIRASLESPPPVLMVTALEDEESVDRSFKAGAVDYIRKPIQWSVLKNRIRYILGASLARHELEQLSRNYEMILDTAANGICGVDEERRISFINPAALTMLRYERDEVIGRSCDTIFKLSMPGTDDFNVNACPFLVPGNVQPASIHHDEIRMIRHDGSSFLADYRATPILRDGRIKGGVIVFQDITERHASAEIIRYMANHDSLTSLRNRNYFHRRLPQAISLAKRYNRMLCLLFIDLDRFKPVNDTYGHAVGDMVLKEVARRLTSMLRSSDSVCRLGGDEFVILLESSNSVEGAKNVAQKAIDLLSAPIEAGKHVCYIGASIGIAVYPLDCEDAETMLRHADIAMYRAKEKGRNRYEFYADDTGPET